MHARSRERLPEIPLAFAALLLPFAAVALPWEAWTAPAQLARLDARDQVLERSSHCYGGCRYDRDGVGSEPPAGNPYPERFLYRDGNGDAVIFDERGPGAITRIWMTTGYGTSQCLDPSITVRFYVDGATTPTLQLPLPALFDGTHAAFAAPLAFERSQSSGGYVSYVPIAWASGLRVTLTEPASSSYDCSIDGQTTTVPFHLLWYQLQFHRLAPEQAADIVPFSASSTFPQWSAWLGRGGANPWNDSPPASTTPLSLQPGGSFNLPLPPGWLRGIELDAPAANYADIALRITLDGSVAVDLPLDQFFGVGAGDAVSPRGALSGRDAAGRLYAWWPMPSTASAQVSLVALPSLAAPVNASITLSLDAVTPVPADAGRFFAVRKQACGGGDVQLLDLAGAGKIVGVNAHHAPDGSTDPNYLEADERLYFDGSVQPRWYGTGLEDFYNGGFYFEAFRAGGPKAFTTPLAGASAVNITGTTAAWRQLPTDAATYQNRLVWRWEAGASPTQVVPTCSSAVFYGYAQPRAALLPYDGFDLGTAAAAAHGYTAPGGAVCTTLNASFEDEPPTPRSAQRCRFAAGSSFFHFAPMYRAAPLRLRRTFDASQPNAPAEIRLNGVLAGHFPFAAADPLRSWQEQDAVLDAAAFAPSGSLNFEIRPLFTAPGNAGGFSDSAYALWGGWTDGIFADGFQ